MLLTETPEAHEDSHVDCSPFHGDGCSGVEAEINKLTFALFTVTVLHYLLSELFLGFLEYSLGEVASVALVGHGPHLNKISINVGCQVFILHGLNFYIELWCKTSGL